MLYEINEIKDRLYTQCEALNFEIPELEMKKSSLLEADILGMETILDCALNLSFRKLIFKYDFGNLNLGGVFFGQTGDYLSFLKKSNLLDDYGSWWGIGKRPKNHLMIAGTDGYVLWQDQFTGKVYVFLRSESHEASSQIALDFTLLVRAAGTIFFERRKTEDPGNLGINIANECGAVDNGGKQFWKELALGIT